jgi:hypothetical protein
LGTFKNNLVEKNTVSITYGATDITITPILDVTSPTTATVLVSGCVLRNNLVTISNTSGAAIMNLRGTILNVKANTAAVTFSDCLVHNNEVNYTGGGSNLTASRASIAGTMSFSASSSTISYINCTFANNKMTNLYSCMHVFQNANVVHKVYNNAFWNNQNTVTSTSTTTGVGISSSSSQIAATVISNNYMDVAAAGNWGTVCTYTNNMTNLSKSNTGANAPIFKSPPMNGVNNLIGSFQTIGAELTSINQSDWRLSSNTSYLYQKGAATSITGILKDKANNDFVAVNPSVGAYEYDASITTSINIVDNLSKLFSTNSNGLISNSEGQVQIISFTGKTLHSIEVTEGQFIPLVQGAYILRMTTNKGVFTQKIMFKL